MMPIVHVGAAQALTISNGITETGNLDTLTSSPALTDSNTDTEQAWVNEVLGDGYTFTYRNEGDEFNWLEVDERPAITPLNSPALYGC